MKYYKEMSEKQVFHKRDVDEITKDENRSKKILVNYLNKGFIVKIAYDYYGARDFSTGTIFADKFLIGSKINDFTFISHRSAFEFYGFYNQVYNEIYVSSNKPFKSFTYDGISYVHVASLLSAQVSMIKGIYVTTIERTIVDAIKDVDKISDIEETLKCIDLILLINSDKLLEYLELVNQKLLFKKVGFILSFFKEQLNLEEELFNILKIKGGNVRGYFSQINKEEQFYDKDWQFYTYDKNYITNIISKETNQISV